MSSKIKLNIVKLTAVIVFIASLLPLCFVSVSATEETSGVCGSELAWSYSCGTLTITGKGDMTSFTEQSMAPWYHLRDNILRVSLPDGLTSVGSLAFYECSRLQNVIIPDSVTRIESNAFACCSSLRSANLGEGLRKIGFAAFYGCSALDAIRFPYGIESIGDSTFYMCESLTSIKLHENLKALGESVFAHCKKLVRAEIYGKITRLPAWTFYGCDMLSAVVLPESVTSVGDFAFRKCETLSVVYYSASKPLQNVIKQVIDADINEEGNGNVSVVDTIVPDQASSSNIAEDNNGNLKVENVLVKQNDASTVVSSVTGQMKPEEDTIKSYSAVLNVTIDRVGGWAEAVETLVNFLKINSENYAFGTEGFTTAVNVYIMCEGGIDRGFLNEIAGRDIYLSVTHRNGSVWEVNCRDLKAEETSEEFKDYSCELKAPSAEVIEKLGTKDCYELTFSDNVEMKAEVVIPLPEISVNSNAFLYQIEDNGDFTCVQGVAVDDNSNAHFYLGAADSETKYVIGVNVPSQSTESVIIPEESFGRYHSPVDRLQNIEYVITGRKSSWGLSFMQVTWIMLGVLFGCAVVIGVVMFVVNKQKQKKRIAELYANKKS